MASAPPLTPSDGDARTIAGLLKALAAVAATACNAEDAWRGALALVCIHTGWPLGHVFTTHPDGSLTSAGVWHDDDQLRHHRFVEATAALIVPRGQGLLGQIETTGEPRWLTDIGESPLFVRAEAALECGLHTAFGFPVVSSDGVEGVMECFTHERLEPDEALLDLLVHIGVQIGARIDQDRANDALRAGEAELREAQRLAQMGSLVWEVGSEEVSCSPELFEIHGLDPDVLPVTGELLMATVHPDDRPGVLSAAKRTRCTAGPYDHEYRVLDRDGETRWIQARGRRVEEAGRPLRITGYCQDITDRKTAELRSRRVERDLARQQEVLARIARGELLETTLNTLCRHVESRYPGARCSVLLVDAEEEVLVHAAAPSLSGRFTQAVDGMPIAQGVAACGTAAATRRQVIVEDVLADPLTSAFAELARTENVRSVWSHPVISSTGDVIGTFAVYRSAPHRPDEPELRSVAATASLAAVAIERHIAETALTAAANVDPLTGLPNRTRFLELLSRRLAERDRRVAVMFLDLDRFKLINDSLGHPSGDRILVEVAQRLQNAVGSQALLARFGGDEFTLMISGATPERIDALAKRVKQACKAPFVLDGGEFFVTVSVGTATNDHPADAYGLVRDADAAMYAAKERGAGVHTVFDNRLRERVLERVALERELRRGIDRDEFVMHFQPILDLATGRWASVEALVRWRHPYRGLLRPDFFIPLAEETGLIVPLGARILELVADQAAAGITAPGVSFAANVSVVQLADPSFGDHLSDVLRRRGLEAGALTLELTESVLMEQLDPASRALERIADLGVRVMIDDFGTGHSSIARLSELPVSGVKIDRRFTSGLDDGRGHDVLAAITSLAHAFDLIVVAEGIEDTAALRRVAALGCEYGQGYRICYPVPGGELAGALRAAAPAV